MFYKFRVTLDGIKGFYRLYIVDGVNTLYTFHKQLRSDLEFPEDQPILFKASDEAGNVIARYALIDLGAGAVDDVKVASVIAAGAVRFVYFYDTAAKKSVTITLEGESSEGCSLPVIVESKGPLPIDFENGYVAFEDMPKQDRKCGCGLEDCDGDCDDCDDEDDEDDDDDDEEEVIYDGNE